MQFHELHIPSCWRPDHMRYIILLFSALLLFFFLTIVVFCVLHEGKVQRWQFPRMVTLCSVQCLSFWVPWLSCHSADQQHILWWWGCKSMEFWFVKCQCQGPIIYVSELKGNESCWLWLFNHVAAQGLRGTSFPPFLHVHIHTCTRIPKSAYVHIP
jgi:hypothetical protein